MFYGINAQRPGVVWRGARLGPLWGLSCPASTFQSRYVDYEYPRGHLGHHREAASPRWSGHYD